MNSTQIEGTAAAWFAKREGGRWSDADQTELNAWLEESTAHRIAFVRLVAAWQRAGRLNALAAGVSSGTVPPRDSWTFAPLSAVPTSASRQELVPNAADPVLATRPESAASRVRRSSAPRFSQRLRAITALGIITAAASAAWYFSIDHSRIYRTPVGTISKVALSDGSDVTLNTDSQVHVELGPKTRRVKLDQGEAFFDVAPDTARPFIVEVADKRVIAVGTQFAVRREDNDLRILVTEGRVRIERRGISSTAVQAQLGPGSEARTSQTALLIDQPAPAQVEQLLSWRTGHLLFHDTALADAVADFNRYSARKIVIDDAAIAGIRIGGSFRTDDVEAFLWLLQNGFPIQVEQRSDRIILTKR